MNRREHYRSKYDLTRPDKLSSFPELLKEHYSEYKEICRVFDEPLKSMTQWAQEEV